jgi:DNA polymerase III epsilon subunit-like protein
MTMIDVMLDLETMGNGPRAAIVAIGAVEFDPDTGTVGERFYRAVDLATARSRRSTRA